jgi:hypothetical protein
MAGGLICAFDPCRRSILGPDIARRAQVHRDGTGLKVFGRGMPDGPLEAAEGLLVEVYHSKCWYSHIKRERILAARSADPSGQPGVTDWRDQESRDVGDLRGEGDRGNRAAGRAGR